MKTLKRTLSLVLTLVMVLGMFGVASAAGFKDQNNVKYNEAVEVMAGIGTINGYEDGSFKPTGAITREEAAKLVAYSVLGKNIADKLTISATGFSDVDAGRWSAPYVAYLVSKGVINGMGDGTFAPTANVTGYQMGKMMLVAAGYGAKDEFVGAGWELAVAVAGNKAGVFAGASGVEYTKPATREEAALYAFNGVVNVPQTSYNKLFDEYKQVEDPKPTGGDAAAVAADKAVYTIAEEVYSTLVVDSTANTDALGNPVKTWKYGSPAKVISQIITEAELTYTTSFKAEDARKALVNKGFTVTSTTPVVVDGKAASDFDLLTNTGVYAPSGNGVLVQFFADSTDTIVKIVVTNTYLAKATDYAEDKADTTTTDERSVDVTVIKGLGVATKAYPAKSPTSGAVAAQGFDAVYAAAKMMLDAKKDAYAPVVLKDNLTNDIISTYIPTIVNGKLDSFVTGTSVTVDSNTYSFNKNFVDAASVLTAANVKANVSVTLVVDSYGYVLGISATEIATNVAYVLNSTAPGAIRNEAVLLLPDATTKVVNTKATASGEVGEFVTYSANADTGVYTITALTGSALTAGTATTETAGSFAVANGNANLKLHSNSLVANANTVFIVKTTVGSTPVYTAYVGVSNVPTMSINSTNTKSAYVLNKAGTVVEIVYIEEPTVAAVASAVPTYIYKDSSTAIVTANGSYYEYDAIVNGEITKVKVDPTYVSSLSAGANLFASVTKQDGFINGGTEAVTESVITKTAIIKDGADSYVAGTTAESAGVIKLGTKAHAVSSSTLVFEVSADGDITASSVAKIKTDANDKYIAVANSDSGLISVLFIQKV